MLALHVPINIMMVVKAGLWTCAFGGMTTVFFIIGAWWAAVPIALVAALGPLSLWFRRSGETVVLTPDTLSIRRPAGPVHTFSVDRIECFRHWRYAPRDESDPQAEGGFVQVILHATTPGPSMTFGGLHTVKRRLVVFGGDLSEQDLFELSAAFNAWLDGCRNGQHS
jgi:hypothetical protein